MAVPASQAGNSFRLNDFDVCSDFSKMMKETDSHFNCYALSADSSDESLHDSSFPTLWFFFLGRVLLSERFHQSYLTC